MSASGSNMGCLISVMTYNISAVQVNDDWVYLLVIQIKFDLDRAKVSRNSSVDLN